MFYLVVKQIGEGCDYTIGCGQKFRKLTGEHPDDCKSEAIRIIQEEYSHDDYRLEKAMIVELVEDLDVDRIYGEKDELEAVAKAELQRKKDEADFERLKRALGK